MPADKPRHLQNPWDLVLSIAPLVLIILLLAGLARACSFSPGGPSSAPPPSIDAAQAFAAAARSEPFPVRAPALPEGWVANSANTTAVAGSSSARVGFVTDTDGYLRLAQSDAAVEALVPAEVEGLTTDDASGTKQAGGRDWQIYLSSDTERAWVTDLGPVRILITGSGSDAQFGTLAAAVLAAEPVVA